MAARGAGAFLSGMSAGLMDGQDRKRRVEDRALRERELGILEQQLSSGNNYRAPADATGGPRGAVQAGAYHRGPAGGPVYGGGTYDGGLPASLVRTESGGNWSVLNSEGYGGRGQFGTERLADAYRAGVISHPMTGAEYARQPPEVQLAVENWQVQDVQNFITQNGLDRYIGQTIGGVEVTPAGMLGVAHLGGKGGLSRFLETGGKYNPSDSNGTSLSDYMRSHAGPLAAPSQGVFANAATMDLEAMISSYLTRR